MNRDDVDWAGYWSAVVTPFFEDEAIDESALRRVVSRTVEHGAHGICINGSTGEWFSQSLDERRRVAEIAVDEVAGRVPTVVAVTCSRAQDAARLAVHAARVGATSVMSAPPPLARPTSNELVSYFSEVLDGVGIPAWIYNFPQDNGHPLTISDIERLSDLDNIVAIKQSSNSLVELIETIEVVGSKLRVFGHLVNGLGLAMIHGGFGGDGQVGSGMLLGRDMPRFFEAAWRGDLETARRIVERLELLMSALAGERLDGYNWAFGGMQPTLKAAMNLLDQGGGFPRRPKLTIDDPEALRAIERILTQSDLMNNLEKVSSTPG